MELSGVTTVFFDVGGTLLFSDPGIPEVFARVARRRGHDIQTRDVEPYIPLIDEYYREQYLKDGDFWADHSRAVELWLDMYKILARETGVRHDAQGIADDVYEEYLDARNWSLFDDVEACLKGLKRRGFRLGVISNWDASLEGLVRGLGLLPYFDDVVASAAVNCRKPHREIFDIACERMGVSASEAVQVGDLPEADGDGARAAGMRAVIIDRAMKLEACDYPRIPVLTDLVSMLER